MRARAEVAALGFIRMSLSYDPAKVVHLRVQLLPFDESARDTRPRFVPSFYASRFCDWLLLLAVGVWPMDVNVLDL
jgi:hypothetical protein